MCRFELLDDVDIPVSGKGNVRVGLGGVIFTPVHTMTDVSSKDWTDRQGSVDFECIYLRSVSAKSLVGFLLT